MTQSINILFVLGPSGVGKSSFGEFLSQQRQWLHLEVDRFLDDGISLLGLRKEWDLFLGGGSAVPLADELRRRKLSTNSNGVVLTFPGNLVFTLEQHANAKTAGITSVYLYGSMARCLGRFLTREQASGRGLTKDHWLQNNFESYMKFSDSGLEPYRLEIFGPNGQQVEWEDVFIQILK